MEEILKANIFFFITSVAVILLSIGIIIAVLYLVRILRDVKHISEIARTQSDLIADDIRDLRTNMRSGNVANGIVNFARGLYKRAKKPKRT